MTLAQMQARFFELKGKLAVGQITEQEFKQALEQLRFQDPHGRWWMIGAQSGRWYYYNGARWLLGDPPDPGAPWLDSTSGSTDGPYAAPRSAQPGAQTWSDPNGESPQTISAPYTYAPQSQPTPAQPAGSNGSSSNYVAPPVQPIQAAPPPPAKPQNKPAAPIAAAATAATVAGVTQAGSGAGVGAAAAAASQATAKHSLGETLHQELGKVRMPHMEMPHLQRPNIQVPPQLVVHTPAPLRKVQPPYILLGAGVVGLLLCALLLIAGDNLIPGKPISSAFGAQSTGRPTAVRIQPSPPGTQNVENQLRVGDELAAKSQFEPALAAYQSAAKAAPNEADVYTHWARALALTGRISEAITTAQKATRLDPTSSTAFAELARALAWAGQTQPAIAAGERAVSLDNENATAHAFLAEAYLRAGKTTEAQQEVDTALEKDDTNPDTHRAAGWVAILSKRNDDGVGEWNRTIELAPDNFLYHYEFGLVFANHLNDPEMAQQEFNRAIELYPPYIPSYVALGRVNLALNQPGPATLLFQKALTLDPESSDSFLGLGQAFQMQQKCPQAIPYYQKALELNKELAFATKGLEDCGAIAKGTAPQAVATEASLPPIATAVPRGTAVPLAGSSNPPSSKATPAVGAGAPINHAVGRIYFPLYDGQYHLYSANPDGSDRQVITELASSPAVNEDGSALLFYSWENDQRGVHRINTDGTGDTHISLRSEDTLPSWSPDSGKYVYATRAGQGGDINKRAFTLRVASSGSKPRQDPAPLVEQAQYPAWGPNDQIAFRDCGYPTDVCGLAVVNADGSGKRKIVPDNVNATAPVWSPDGSKIVFMSNVRGNWDLWVVGANGGSPELLTDDVGNDGLPTFSPDGSKIAFVSNRGDGWGMYQIDADGENELKLFDLGGDLAGAVDGNSPAQPGQTWLEQRITWR